MITARGAEKKAPAMVKKDGWYYLFSSGTNGWMPTACGYMAARTVKGLADAKLMMYGNSATYGAQSGGVKIWGTETKKLCDVCKQMVGSVESAGTGFRAVRKVYSLESRRWYCYRHILAGILL